MDYRIIIETEASGKKWYYVQYRCLFFFWRYHREVKDLTMHPYKIGYDTLEEAEQQIQRYINWKYIKSQKKIVKREVFNPEI